MLTQEEIAQIWECWMLTIFLQELQWELVQ